jgi:hypothetical protein
MLELLGLVAAGGAAAVGYARTRRFVADRLRYVDAVQKPSAPLIAGTVAAVAAAPVVWVVPVIGGGTAILFGIAVGAGVRAGVNRIRRSLAPGS